jgi:hypothetical protein
MEDVAAGRSYASVHHRVWSVCASLFDPRRLSCLSAEHRLQPHVYRHPHVRDGPEQLQPVPAGSDRAPQRPAHVHDHRQAPAGARARRHGRGAVRVRAEHRCRVRVRVGRRDPARAALGPRRTPRELRAVLRLPLPGRLGACVRRRASGRRLTRGASS